MLAIAGFLQLSTMGVAPYLHLDEFMIVDLGRTVMDPRTDWSIAWIAGSDRPVFFWFYLGSVAQELVFRAAGEYGPRVFALCGALLASGIMLRYLLLRGTQRIPARVLGLAFLLDPLFVQSYSMGRLDSWALASGLLACMLLREIDGPQSLRRPSYSRVILAGAVMAAGWLIWPSSVFLLPLLAIELREAAVRYRTIPQRLTAVGSFGLGCIGAGLVLMLPLTPVVIGQLPGLADGIATNTRSGSAAEPLSAAYYLAQLRELIRILKFSPVTVILVLLTVLRRPKQDLVYGMLCAAGIMVLTVVYIHRVQYLLPYFIVLIAGLYPASRQPAPFARRRRPGIRKAWLAALIIWCTGISVISRTILALEHRQERNRDLVYRAAESMIGAGHYGVLMPGEFYYAGRRLGWKMYKPYLAQNEPMTPETLEKVLPRLEYVIWSGSTLPAVFRQTLTANGMHEQGTMRLYTRPARAAENVSWANGLRNLFSVQRQPYGPYTIYGRGKAQGQSINR